LAYDLIPRVKFEIVALDPQVEDIVYAIIESARTGEHGDGIVSISNVERAINIYHLGHKTYHYYQQEQHLYHWFIKRPD
jgi:nitrogen regulatory protein PII